MRSISPPLLLLRIILAPNLSDRDGRRRWWRRRRVDKRLLK